MKTTLLCLCLVVITGPGCPGGDNGVTGGPAIDGAISGAVDGPIFGAADGPLASGENRCHMTVVGDSAAAFGPESFDVTGIDRDKAVSAGFFLSATSINCIINVFLTDDAGVPNRFTLKYTVQWYIDWLNVTEGQIKAPFTATETSTNYSNVGVHYQFHTGNYIVTPVGTFPEYKDWLCRSQPGDSDPRKHVGTFTLNITELTFIRSTPGGSTDYLVHGTVHAVCPNDGAPADGSMTFDAVL